MYFKKLEITGFKSFASKTILEFPKPAKNCPLAREVSGNSPLPKGQCGISAIVGPNGSGKSNISDAIRWGLGEQSLKSLRGKKATDVIFSGTDKRNRLSLAEVSLFFNNEDGTIPVDFPEVVFSRRLYRNGEAEYLINKKKVRLQDTLMLAAKANFGQKSYSVVSQGTIDSFLNATLIERKEFFDEAAGVKQYQIKRDQSVNKLKNAWENLKQAEMVLNEITPLLRSLTRQVNKLERKEKIEKDLKITQRKHYYLGWAKLDQQKDVLQPKFNQFLKQVAIRRESLNKIQKELSQIERQDTRTDTFSKLQQKYQKIIEKKNKLREEQIVLESKIQLIRQRRVEAPKTLPLLEIISSLKRIRQGNKDLLSELDMVKDLNQLSRIKKSARELNEKTNFLIIKLENPSKEAKTEEPPTELISNLKDLTLRLKFAEDEIKNVQQEITDFNKNQDKQRGQFFELQRQFQHEQNLFHHSSNELNEIKIELAKIETKRDDLNLEIKQELGDSNWLKDFKPEGQINESFLFEEIQHLKKQLELIGGIDPEVTEEFKKTKERHDFLESQAMDLRKSITDLKKVISDLDDTVQKKFDASFKKINTEFQKYFRTLFSGGKADLTLVKEEDLLSLDKGEKQKGLDNQEGYQATSNHILSKNENQKELLAEQTDQEAEEDKEIRKIINSKHDVIKGIEIEVSPPGKKIKSISMMSGGEKAMTSIALICAIISSNPSPFVVLDEVDAALDEANSERFSAILDELAHKTQFIVITHNRATMQKANILYGVSMGDDGVSKLLSIQLEEARLASSQI